MAFWIFFLYQIYAFGRQVDSQLILISLVPIRAGSPWFNEFASVRNFAHTLLFRIVDDARKVAEARLAAARTIPHQWMPNNIMSNQNVGRDELAAMLGASHASDMVAAAGITDNYLSYLSKGMAGSAAGAVGGNKHHRGGD